MRGQFPQRSIFRLESLEARTLLASGDFAEALTADAPYLFNFEPVSASAVVAARDGGNLIIDASLLPASLTDLSISGFDNVTINGTEKLNLLSVSNVKTFNAPNLDIVGTLQITMVSSVNLNSIKGVASLAGTETRLQVGDARSATIYTELDRLSVSSSNKVFLISGNSNQEIQLEFNEPGQILGRTKVLQSTDLTPDAVTTVSGGSFDVIILSLSPANKDSNQLMQRLRTALKQGDVANANALLSDILKTTKLAEGNFAVAFPVSISVELNLAQIGHALHQTNFPGLVEPTGDRLGLATLLSPTPDQAVNRLSLPDLSDNHRAREVVSTAYDDHSSVAAFTPAETTVRNLDGQAAIVQSGPVDVAAPTTISIWDQVRSTLSSLTSGVNPERETVSAYIVGQLGSELHPGTRPGLLVDAKAGRSTSSRESLWIEI